MAATKYTLSYFPLRARAETARLVLHAAKKDFVDNIVQFSEWGALKPKTPFGSLPVLEVGDKSFGQGQAIASYLARECGLYGSSNLDALKIEQLQQLREDLLVEEVNAWKEGDAAKKAELKKKMNDIVYPRFLNYFEKLVQQNQTESGTKYTVGDKLSLADIIIFEGTETVRQQYPGLLDNLPAIKSVNALVAEVDGIKQYLKKRPVLAL